jgi:hypothetical protein
MGYWLDGREVDAAAGGIEVRKVVGSGFRDAARRSASAMSPTLYRAQCRRHRIGSWWPCCDSTAILMVQRPLSASNGRYGCRALLLR